MIDHMAVRRPEMYANHGTLEVGIADHSLVFAARKKPKFKQKTTYVWASTYQNYNNAAFLADIMRADWSNVMNELSVDKCVEYFYNILLPIIDHHTPYQQINCKEEKPVWITNDFLALIDKRNYLIKRYKCDHSDDNFHLKEEAIHGVKQANWSCRDRMFKMHY